MTPELKRETDRKIENYRNLNKTIKKGQILFVGSSLMEQFPIEEFVAQRKLPLTVYNRGVGGYRTEDLMKVLDVCVFDLEPHKIFINIGTNDLSDASLSIEQVMTNYEQILSEIQDKLPQAELYLMAYYPVNYDVADEGMKACLRIRNNAKIAKANEQVKKLAQRKSARYIDVNAPLTDAQGNLKAEYTIEGMHIKKEGYLAILDDVLKYVNETEDYIKGNKEAWEEAFDLRDAAWGADISERVPKEDYAFFNQETIEVLKKYNLEGKTIGQFCCNNGRELLSLVRTTNAKAGVGFDIAENMVNFANEKAKELHVPCSFIQKNILEIDDRYVEQFDAVIITIGALCWFKDLKDYFAIVAKCMKKGAAIIINEQHSFTNMLAVDGDDEYDEAHPLNCAFSYFSHEWIGNDGMGYIAGRNYASKTFTDYTHSVSEIIGSMCANGIVITNMQEFDYDISGGFGHLNHRGFPLSMIIEGIVSNDL